MKSEPTRSHKQRSRAALTASALFERETAAYQPELSSLVSDSLGQLRRRHPATESFRPTSRDQQLVELAFRLRAFRHDQAQLALFSPGNASGCQRRLTLLVRHHYLDRLPRRSVSDPAIYLLTRGSIQGNRLMRAKWGEAEFRRLMTRLGSINHLLAVNDVRVRLERACQDAGWNLVLWQTPDKLQPTLGRHSLVPDAYLQVRRVVNGEPRTAAFFLEVERVAKSHQVLASKLERYHRLYYTGEYQRLFGTRALRVLFVFATGALSSRLCEHGRDAAEQLGVTIARFASLDRLKAACAISCLMSDCWLSPGSSQPVALFPADRQGASM